MNLAPPCAMSLMFAASALRNTENIFRHQTYTLDARPEASFPVLGQASSCLGT